MQKVSLTDCPCWLWLTAADGAEIINVTSVLLVSDGDSAVLECQVTANPLSVDRLITWSRTGYDMSRAVIEATAVDQSRLTIAAVERRDTGAFQCNAFNGIGVASTAVAELIVKCKGAITSKIKHAIKHKTSPARLAQLLYNCCSPH